MRNRVVTAAVLRYRCECREEQQAAQEGVWRGRADDVLCGVRENPANAFVNKSKSQWQKGILFCRLAPPFIHALACARACQSSHCLLGELFDFSGQSSETCNGA